MPQIIYVKKSRKSPGICKCGKRIRKGKPYQHWSFRYGGKRIRCMEPGCKPRPSELTPNGKWSTLFGAQETVEDAIAALKSDGDLEGLQSALSEAAEEIRSVGEELREGSENIESGFEHSTSQSEAMEEGADQCDTVADSFESVSGDLEDFQSEDGDDKDKAQTAWREEQAQKAEDVLNEIDDISWDG